MKILKQIAFNDGKSVADFVNDNNIEKEDILTIVISGMSTSNFNLYFYNDADIKEKTRNIWGNLKS